MPVYPGCHGYHKVRCRPTKGMLGVGSFPSGAPGLFPAEGFRAVRPAKPASFLLLSEPGDAYSCWWKEQELLSSSLLLYRHILVFAIEPTNF